MRYRKIYPLKVLSILVCSIIITTISSCYKDDMYYPNNPDYNEKLDFSIYDAKNYFETSTITLDLTKSENYLKQGFYTGEFVLDWKNARFSSNGVLSGYDIDIISPQYEFAVEKDVFVNGKETTVDIEVSQKLVILKHNTNGRMAQYILTLIPDMDYYEKCKHDVKRKFLSNSNTKDFSGIAIHALPKIGVPVCITKYKNGKIVSSVYMVARTQNQILENSQKASELIGMIRVKIKENAFTKGGGTWNLDKYVYLGGGYYYDGVDVWLDFDGDGMPDYRLKDTVYVNGESGGSGGSSGNGGTPNPDDDWGGDGLGNPNEGNGGGGGNNGNTSDGDNNGEPSGNGNSSGANDDIVYTGENCERIVRPLIQTLSKSKMVRTLIEELGDIAFQTGNFENPGAYDPNNGIINVSTTAGVYDFVVLEELVHKLQHNNNNIRFGENNNKLNIEIEAKILIFLYNQKYPTDVSISNCIGGDDLMWLQLIDNYIEKRSDESYQDLVDYFRNQCSGYGADFKDHPNYRNTNNIDAYIDMIRKE